MTGAPLVLYDGDCGLCAGSVRFLIALDRSGRLRYAPLSGPTAAPILARHPKLADIDSVVLVEDPGAEGERVAVWSEAVLGAVALIGGPARILLLGRLLPRRIRDAFYRFIARRRHRWFRPADACELAPPNVRSRFLP